MKLHNTISRLPSVRMNRSVGTDDSSRRRVFSETNTRVIALAFRDSIANVAVIDSTGRIIAANQGWLNFAREHGGQFGKIGPGANYLDVCRTSIRRSGDQDAFQALRGIAGVLDGSVPRFTLQYPCHTHSEELTCEMIVQPLRRREGGALISHLVINRLPKLEMLGLGRMQPQPSVVVPVEASVSKLPSSSGFDLRSPATQANGQEPHPSAPCHNLLHQENSCCANP